MTLKKAYRDTKPNNEKREKSDPVNPCGCPESKHPHLVLFPHKDVPVVGNTSTCCAWIYSFISQKETYS